MAYMGEALPERGTLFSGFKYMKDYKGICHFCQGPKGLTDAFNGYGRVKKTFCFCVYSFLKKTSAFIAVKRDTEF